MPRLSRRVTAAVPARPPIRPSAASTMHSLVTPRGLEAPPQGARHAKRQGRQGRYVRHRQTCSAAMSSTAISALHTLITFYPAPFYALMIAMPGATFTRKVLSGAWTLVPLALIYAFLLCASWTPDTLSTLLPGDLDTGLKSLAAGKPEVQFIPSLDGIAALLSRPISTLSTWAHLQFITFFCARWIWLDGLARGVLTAHSVLMCALLPPIGFISHIVSCRIWAAPPSGTTSSSDNSQAKGSQGQPAAQTSASSSSSAAAAASPAAGNGAASAAEGNGSQGEASGSAQQQGQTRAPTEAAAGNGNEAGNGNDGNGVSHASGNVGTPVLEQSQDNGSREAQGPQASDSPSTNGVPVGAGGVGSQQPSTKDWNYEVLEVEYVKRAGRQ